MIHTSADVQSKNIGSNTYIWQFVVVLKDATIGNNCNINAHTFIENNVIIGNNVTVKSGVYLWDGIRLEDDVFIGPNATFTNDLLPRSKQYPDSFEETIVKKGASIGANCTIIAGNTINKYAMVGAGSVVTKNIPAYQLWFGNPASHHGYITEKGEVIGLDLVSKATGKKYKYGNNLLTIA